MGRDLYKRVGSGIDTGNFFCYIWVALKSTVLLLPQGNNRREPNYLGTLSSDSSGQLDVLGHDGNSLGVDGTQVGVLEESNKVSLTSLLQGHHRSALESQVSLEILGDLTDQTLEGQLPQEQFSGLLVPPDLSKGNGSWPVPVGLLHSSGGGSTLSSGLGGELLSGSLSSGRFTGGLLGSGHVDSIVV